MARTILLSAPRAVSYTHLILVVEDDAKLRSLFCTVLNRSGYLTVPASGGREALELLDSEYIDLIISDIMMPGMDGYELIRTLRGKDVYKRQILN